jgi:uncharacterized membrane protein YhaH (DUF805 family)
MFGLVHGLIAFALSYPHFLRGRIDPETRLGQIGIVYLLATFVPLIAVSVRRLHDANLSGWWILMLFVPLANLVFVLSFKTRASDPGENRYGPSPNPEPTGVV